MAGGAILVKDGGDVFVVSRSGGEPDGEAAAAMPAKTVKLKVQKDSFDIPLMAVGDGATERVSARAGHRAARHDSIQGVSQIELGGLDAGLAKIFDAVVDAAEIKHRAVAGQDDGFWRNCRAGVMRQDELGSSSTGKR